MRILVAGLGNACLRGHLPALARLERAGTAEIVGVADPDPRRRQLAAERLPGVATFDTAAEMLAAIGADALVVASEPDAHPGLVRRGLERGLHVVCEKPLAVTRYAHEQLVRACAVQSEPALVAVHQYRFSPQWRAIERHARRLGRLSLPYTLTIDVERPGFDSAAVSDWRPSATGGMPADAGVHFLALAWRIERRLEPVRCERWRDGDGERSTSIAGTGAGGVRIRTWRGAPARRTRIELRGGGGAICWSDSRAEIAVGRVTLGRRRVAALSDRVHVDALYSPLYEELVYRLPERRWRARRTREALEVNATLVALLEPAADPGLVA